MHPKKASPKTKPKKVEEEDKGQVSEFSSLEDDEEPKKKKARKSKSSPANGEKDAKKASTSKTTTADSIETKLKKLKNLVTLCGTRKPWKKLFEEAGCPDSETGSDEQKLKARKGQIAVVEKTLLDLGMVRSSIRSSLRIMLNAFDFCRRNRSQRRKRPKYKGRKRSSKI